MKIVFNTFNGMLPRLNVGIKPDHCAKVAWNCDLRDGRLRPVKQALLVSSDYPLVNADYSDADAVTVSSAQTVGASLYLLKEAIYSNTEEGRVKLERWTPGMDEPEIVLEELMREFSENDGDA